MRILMAMFVSMAGALAASAVAQQSYSLAHVVGVWRTKGGDQQCWGEYVFRLRDGRVNLFHKAVGDDHSPLDIAANLDPNRPLNIPILWQEGRMSPASPANPFRFQLNNKGELILNEGSAPPCVMSRQ